MFIRQVCFVGVDPPLVRNLHSHTGCSYGILVHWMARIYIATALGQQELGRSSDIALRSTHRVLLAETQTRDKLLSRHHISEKWEILAACRSMKQIIACHSKAIVDKNRLGTFHYLKCIISHLQLPTIDHLLFIAQLIKKVRPLS